MDSTSLSPLTVLEDFPSGKYRQCPGESYRGQGHSEDTLHTIEHAITLSFLMQYRQVVYQRLKCIVSDSGGEGW